MGKYFFKKGIVELHFLVKNTQGFLYPFLRNRGGCVGGTERTSACYGESCNSSRLVYLRVSSAVSVRSSSLSSSDSGAGGPASPPATARLDARNTRRTALRPRSQDILRAPVPALLPAETTECSTKIMPEKPFPCIILFSAQSLLAFKTVIQYSKNVRNMTEKKNLNCFCRTFSRLLVINEMMFRKQV